MKSVLKNVNQTFEKALNKSYDSLDAILAKKSHHIIITGLSRSGKSMLFTSLMTLFGQRSVQGFDNLPLLKVLPKEMVESFEVLPIPGQKHFPLEENIMRLQSRQWPKATEDLYGFELLIKLKPTNLFKKLTKIPKKISFRFYDYPGEWLTDLPMLDMTFISWSNATIAQQSSAPQKYYANDWTHFVESFDFDVQPTPEAIEQYVNQYRGYMTTAKQAGISLLQPGSLLLPREDIINWKTNGFAPLPTKISCDPDHPWTIQFQQAFQTFQTKWLLPLKESYFSKADKQIMLVDMLAGLNHGKAHLTQLKETISHLSTSFVYGANKWYKPKMLFGFQITKVAFVATKVDLIPMNQQPKLLSLLQEVTSGVRSHLKESDVEFQHFLVSAIQTSDPGSSPDSIRITNPDGEYEECFFVPLPESLKELKEKDNYPIIESKVPQDLLPRINNAQGIDRLINYLIT